MQVSIGLLIQILLFLQCSPPLLAGVVIPTLMEECTFAESDQIMQFRQKSYQYAVECKDKNDFHIEMVNIGDSFNKLELSMNSVGKEGEGLLVQVIANGEVYFTTTSINNGISSCNYTNDTFVDLDLSGVKHAYINRPIEEILIKYRVLSDEHCHSSGQLKLEKRTIEEPYLQNNNEASRLLKRSKRQVANEASEPYLLLNNGHQIYQYSLDGRRSHSLLSTLGVPLALTYNLRRKVVYWSEGGTIKRANLDGSGVITLISGVLNLVDGLAADWITSNLYFTDVNQNILGVVDYTTSWFRVLFQFVPNSQPRAIVLDPRNRMMYWTDWGAVATIERASMDGTNRQVLHNTSLVWPNALTIDYQSQTLYWADANLDKLESSKVDGTNRITLSTIGLSHPFGITLYQSILYITDWTGSTLRTFFLESQSSVNVLISLVPCNRPFGIEVVSPQRQEMSSNPCEDNNGGCSHLCLLSTSEKGYSCACPVGLSLLNDNTCTAGTLSISLSPEIPGSCTSAGHTTCCDGTISSCEGSPSNCYCDADCHLYNDCCSDVNDLCSTEGGHNISRLPTTTLATIKYLDPEGEDDVIIIATSIAAIVAAVIIFIPVIIIILVCCRKKYLETKQSKQNILKSQDPVYDEVKCDDINLKDCEAYSGQN